MHATARRFWGFVQLLGTGLVAAAGLTAIASNRWRLLDPGTAVFLLLFTQWQTFCLTIAKSGLDQVVFATTSQDPSLTYDARATVRRRVLPLSAAVAAIALLAFPPWAALAIGVSVALDSYSLMVGAEMSARMHYGAAAIGNVLNYPLFFLLAAGLAGVGLAGPPQLVAAFVVSSAVRALYVDLRWRRPPASRLVTPAVQAPIAVQQVANYALFRGDQLLLGLGVVQGALGASPAFLSAYLFLAKLPELAAGALTTAGTVAFPVLVGPGANLGRRLRSPLGLAVAAIGLLGLGLAGALYLLVWKGPQPLTLWQAAPFLLHAVLIFPVNAVTYAMLGRGALAGLLRFLAGGLCLGGLLVAVALATGEKWVMAWLAPLQLATFLTAAALVPWGRQRPIYRGGGDAPSARR